MYTPSLCLSYNDKIHNVSAAGEGSIPASSIRTLDHCAVEAHKFFNLPPGTYDLADRFGKIEYPEDLQRALDTAGNGECIVEIQEHLQFIRIRDLQVENTSQNDRMTKIEEMLRASEERQNKKLQESHNELREYIQRIESRIVNELEPTVGELCRDRDQILKDLRKAQEKLRQINVRELREMKEGFDLLREEVKANIKRVDRIDTMFTTEMARIDSNIEGLTSDLKELHRYITGKFEVLVQADAELAHDHQNLDERVKMLRDDHTLLREDHTELNELFTNSKESVENCMTTLKEVKENNDTLMIHGGHFRTRIHVLEFFAMENWNGFFPGVTYYRHWDADAKGEDVQHSRDLSLATGRGNYSSTGVVIKATEGLTVANGVCRRFGKDKYWTSYYEVEVEELCAAPTGSGGLFVGFTVNSPEEICDHPRKEYNGWMMGGNAKALMSRSGRIDRTEEEQNYSPENMPATWAPGYEVCETAFEIVEPNVQLLRATLPPRKYGEIREVPASFVSEETRTWAEDLSLGDLIGVMIRFREEGGCRLRVSVNGEIVGTHEFMDAPPDEAIGYLYPAVRLSGTGKAVRLKRNMMAPENMLEDW